MLELSANLSKTSGNPNSTTSTQSQNQDNKSSNLKFNARCTKEITTSRILVCDRKNWDKMQHDKESPGLIREITVSGTYPGR